MDRPEPPEGVGAWMRRVVAASQALQTAHETLAAVPRDADPACWQRAYDDCEARAATLRIALAAVTTTGGEQ